MMQSHSRQTVKYDRSMPQMFNLATDVEARLNHTIIRYDEEPVYVCNVNSSKIFIQTLDEYVTGDSRIHRSLSFDDPLLDISSPPIGYFNMSKEEAKRIFGDHNPDASKSRAGYCYRNPAKQWKQGLRLGHLVTREPSQPDTHFMGGYSLNFCKPVREMILGEFPSVQEALFSLDSEEAESVAISREVALVRESTGAITVAIEGVGAGILLPTQSKVYVQSRRHSWVIEEQLSRFQLEVKNF